jgi:hypothetical protein
MSEEKTEVPPGSDGSPEEKAPESWEEQFKKMTEGAKEGPPVLMAPDQQVRREKCDSEVTRVCLKFNCVPVVVETTTSIRVNGQPMVPMINTRIDWMPKEMMENPPMPEPPSRSGLIIPPPGARVRG